VFIYFLLFYYITSTDFFLRHHWAYICIIGLSKNVYPIVFMLPSRSFHGNRVYLSLRIEGLTLSNPIFLPTAYTQLLYVLGGKEFGGVLVIILQF
jgi:hypothetical protein